MAWPQARHESCIAQALGHHTPLTSTTTTASQQGILADCFIHVTGLRSLIIPTTTSRQGSQAVLGNYGLSADAGLSCCVNARAEIWLKPALLTRCREYNICGKVYLVAVRGYKTSAPYEVVYVYGLDSLHTGRRKPRVCVRVQREHAGQA